ncbi:Ribonuclease/ribotoxin [Hypoxylon rubiginosum]|uniref:Ribonuclease/ribotoxin n=1 Tax=Hypoxylon rubiginosum TaxID=110542 RepID=A0ACC0D699_9PEZI|nr:Ribonuclease/ribotoxin [Hypoxylon rubiginosum]
MMFKTALILGVLANFANADYRCATNRGNFNIKSAWANDAKTNGGSTTGKSGFPHAFGGSSGSNAQLRFYGSDNRCNEQNPSLYEFPVMKDGSKYAKDEKHGQTETPARVVYLQADTSVLCGVMTHVIEDATDHHGSGDFRVCDWVDS